MRVQGDGLIFKARKMSSSRICKLVHFSLWFQRDFVVVVVHHSKGGMVAGVDRRVLCTGRCTKKQSAGSELWAGLLFLWPTPQI